MAKYCLKKPSKRLSTKKKHKIERKVREHNRKARKEAKSKLHGKKAVKMVSVPNKCPFKENVLIEAEMKREEIKQKKKEKKIEAKSLTKNQKAKLKATIEANVKKASLDNINSYLNDNGDPAYCLKSTDLEVSTEANANAAADKTVKSFAGEVRKTIESADVIIEVLDARDPLGSRSRRIEELVISQGKRLVLLLNKIDLVPRENVTKWIAYLRNELPTIAFKASTQEQNTKLSRYLTANLNSASAKCIGADLVMKLLGNYCRNKDIRTSIRVGIVGFPNVGKSSVINSLKRKKSCPAGSTPGLTRHIQEVQLDKHICLIDSPGVVLATKDEEFDSTELALKNALRVDVLEDPFTPISAILRRCSVKVLMLHYTIPEFSDAEQFLALVARRFGKIKKGGRANLTAAARHVLDDWNNGKLRYHTEPPESASSNGNVALLTSEVLNEFSKEFDLDALDNDLKTLVENVPEVPVDVVETVYDPSKPVYENDENMIEEGDDTEEGEMEVDDGDSERRGSKKQKFVVTGEPKKKKVTFAEDGPRKLLPESLKIDGNVRLNHAIKGALKKHKKQQKKIANRADKMANALSSKTLHDSSMDYDFGVLE